VDGSNCVGLGGYDGDSAILTYNVQWDQGTGDFVELVGETSSFLGQGADRNYIVDNLNGDALVEG